MSLKLDSLASFYKGKMASSAPLPESMDHKIVYYTLVTFTVAGFLTIFARLIQFARLMLSLFVLPGRPVGILLCSQQMQFNQAKVAISAPHLWPTLQNMGTRHRSFGRHWQGVRPPAIPCRLLHPPRIPHCQQARRFSNRNQNKIQHPHQNSGHGLWSQ